MAQEGIVNGNFSNRLATVSDQVIKRWTDSNRIRSGWIVFVGRSLSTHPGSSEIYIDGCRGNQLLSSRNLYLVKHDQVPVKVTNSLLCKD